MDYMIINMRLVNCTYNPNPILCDNDWVILVMIPPKIKKMCAFVTMPTQIYHLLYICSFSLFRLTVPSAVLFPDVFSAKKPSDHLVNTTDILAPKHSLEELVETKTELKGKWILDVRS